MIKEPFVDKCERGETNLALYEDEYHARGQSVSQMLRSLSLYNSILPSAEDAESHSSKFPPARPASAASQPLKMGTFMGVYMPCMQNIFGVLFFIRLAWIVGTAGTLAQLTINMIWVDLFLSLRNCRSAGGGLSVL